MTCLSTIDTFKNNHLAKVSVDYTRQLQTFFGAKCAYWRKLRHLSIDLKNQKVYGFLEAGEIARSFCAKKLNLASPINQTYLYRIPQTSRCLIDLDDILRRALTL